MRSVTRPLAWLGLALSFALIAFALWIHREIDPLLRILPVLIFGGAGLLLGLLSVQGLLATATPPHPWTRPAPESLRGPASAVAGLALIAAGVHGWLSGTVRTPNVVFERAVEAAQDPVAYWALVASYLVAGATLVASGARMTLTAPSDTRGSRPAPDR